MHRLRVAAFEVRDFKTHFVELKPSLADLEILQPGELHQPLELSPIVTAQPYFPPDRLILCRIGLGCIRPQTAQGGEPQGRHGIEHAFVAALALLPGGILRVALETPDEVLHSSVGHEDSGALYALGLGPLRLPVSDGDQLDPPSGALQAR